MAAQDRIDVGRIRTRRLVVAVREAGDPDGEPVLFVHGNVSTGRVWHHQLAALPAGLRGLAVDLRGYGGTERKPVDATRGMRDWSEDLHALVEELALGPVHLVAHSMGAGVALQYATNSPSHVRSIALVAPMSPYGFGGTRDERGTPCYPDFAGSGAGTVNPELPRRIAAGDRRAEDAASPRNVIRSLFFPSPAAVREEEEILDDLLATAVGPGHYPGDTQWSRNWPHVAPGRRGVANAFSPKWCDVSGFATSGCRAPLLWVRGGRDAVIGDGSPLDFAVLGRIGVVPGWPGAQVYPPQPMLAQTRAVLETYASAGGSYREEVLPGAGHFPFTQEPQPFTAMLAEHLTAA